MLDAALDQVVDGERGAAVEVAADDDELLLAVAGQVDQTHAQVLEDGARPRQAQRSCLTHLRVDHAEPGSFEDITEDAVRIFLGHADEQGRDPILDHAGPAVVEHVSDAGNALYELLLLCDESVRLLLR